MGYQITSDNIDISPSMIVLTKQKLAKLDHHLAHIHPDLISYRVVLNSIPDNAFEAKLEVQIKGKVYFAHEKHHVLESAIILATEDLDKQLKKVLHKEKAQEWEQKREQKRLTEEDLEKD